MRGKRWTVLVGLLAFAFLLGCLSWAGEPEYLRRFEKWDIEKEIAKLKAAIKQLESSIREIRKLSERIPEEMKPLRERPGRLPMPPLRERGELKFYKLEHVRAPDAFEIINKFLSPIGAAWFDKRTNSLIVRDLPEYLDDVERIIRFIDVPAHRTEIGKRREVVRRRVREAERGKRVEVERGVVLLEPGQEREVTLFKGTDMPISISFKPTVEDEKVKLRLVIGSPKWEVETSLAAKLGAPKVVERKGLRIKYEVNKAREGKLRIDYEVKRGR